MTVHASVELVEAMRGVVPTFIQMHSNPNAGMLSAYDASNACGEDGGGIALAFNVVEEHYLQPFQVVDCPRCLEAMREATDPVRYDFLRERGLVPELPLVSG